MSENIWHAIKKDNLYLRNKGYGNEYVTLDRAWLLTKEGAEKLLRYYPGEVVKVKLEEVE